ncbi:MAG: cytochrome c peroxidase [Acidobacteriota bacterium]|nr:cytochrome c peroxidase [Acidobacteriota bacterium]
MKRYSSRSLGVRIGAVVAVVALLGLAWGLAYYLRSKRVAPTSSKFQSSIPSNQLMQNPGGEAATFSAQGSVNLTGEYFKPQGTNGQSCATCHIPEEAWSITPGTLQHLFDETDGTHPVFNLRDANNPNMDVSTPEARRAAYSMLLTRGVFRRGGAPRPDSEWELLAVEDPHGFANVNQLVHWRRAMPTINFAVGSATVNWDAGSNVGKGQRAALVNLTNRLVTNALQGPPPTAEVINDIVGFEESLWTAQVTVPGVGRLDSDGARGGPQALSTMSKVEGEFHLFDAWAGDANPKRAQIARGQELFNSTNVGHLSCNACHNSVNNGTNISNTLFDINTASAEARTPDLPLYTFRNKRTGETRQLTDAGLGNITGLWDDLGRFKTPTLRALAARPPYFHNGIAATLEDVVRHYEKHFGFRFTDEERADLVAFLGAL